MLNVALTGLGLALLLVGGEAVVRGAVAAARRLGISPLVIGLTVIGFGTSAPELVVSVEAALSGAPALAVGNVLGSNIANILLIVGIAALLSPLVVHPDALRRDGVVLLLVTLAFPLVALNGGIGRAEGLVMVGLLIAYIAGSIWSDRRHAGPTAELHREEVEGFTAALPRSGWVIALFILAGLAALVGGAQLAVTGATALAREAGISETVIGITLVAIGTSLPELSTAIAAARRGNSDVCIGNIIGSNLFNILGVAGASAIAAPLPFDDPLAVVDLWIMLGVTALLMAFMLTGQRIVRREGCVLLALYGVFIAFQFLAGGGVSA
ncbi:MAG: calcium/sodium antiporter [Alphaproteobacteria bacterium]